MNSSAPSRNPYPADRDSARLARTIEGEIIPRLMLVHNAAVAGDGDGVFSERAIADYAELVLQGIEPAVDRVNRQIDQGVAAEVLLLELLAPTARYLGKLWEQDLCDFTSVTVGLCRLHRVLHELNPQLRRTALGTGSRPRALLAPVPGEQHTFGLCMVTAFLHQAAWDVWVEPAIDGAALLELLSAEPFDLLGLSLSCDDRLTQLGEQISAARGRSRNPHIGVLVGGRVFADQPRLIELVGADGWAADGRAAAREAQTLYARLSASGDA